MRLDNLKSQGKLIANPNDRDTYNRYLKDINRLEPLSREQETELFKQYKETGDLSIKEKICKHNLLFVISVAKRYSAVVPYSTLTLEDLISDGNLGLCIAIDKFDHTAGNKFISYAVWWIRQQILSSIQNNFKNIRLPSNIKQIISKIEAKECELEQLLGREVSSEEIYHAFADSDLPIYSQHSVTELLKMNSFETSLNRKVSVEDDSELIDLVKSDFKTPDETLELKQRYAFLEEMVSTLPDMVKNYFIDYFGLYGNEQLSLKKMGDKYERTGAGIKYVIDKYMRNLKYRYKKSGAHLFPNTSCGFNK